MPRIPEISSDSATPEQRRLPADEEASYGAAFNTTRIYAHVPSLLPQLRALHTALAEAGNVPEELVSLVRLRTAQINGCSF